MRGGPSRTSFRQNGFSRVGNTVRPSQSFASPSVCVTGLFHNPQLNVDIAQVTINSNSRFMDRPARVTALLAIACLPASEKFDQIPRSPHVDALAIQLIHYAQDVIADLKHLLGRRACQNLPGTLGRTECVNGDRTWSGRIDWLGEGRSGCSSDDDC